MKEEIRTLQAETHKTIQSVGGYWHPCAATSRLLEEVGEVNELYLSRRNGRALKEEMCDVLVISTCLANQYCIDLEDWIKHYEDPTSITGLSYSSKVLTADWIAHLCVLAGQVGRMVNAYEGVKQPKNNEDVKQLGFWISALHSHLIGLANNLGITLLAEAIGILASKGARDRGRFSISYDPTTSPSLEAFRAIQAKTSCPFAPEARLWGAPQWDNSQGIDRNVERVTSALQRFTTLHKWEVIDGFVLQITSPDLYANLASLSAALRGILVELNRRDPTQVQMSLAKVRDEAWQFQFNNVRLFVISFAPFYDADSPRETYGLDSAFILFQPEGSFIESRIPRGGGKPATRESIRRRFAEHGKPYDGELVRQPFEAPRYVKPLRLSDPEVAWWETHTKRDSPRQS